MLLCLSRGTGRCLAAHLQFLPYRLKLLLIYLLCLQDADKHTEKVLLLPRKYLPVIFWSSLPFLLPPGTTGLMRTTLFRRNSLIRLLRAAYNTTTQRELSYKDTTVFQSQDKAKAWRSPQLGREQTLHFDSQTGQCTNIQWLDFSVKWAQNEKPEGFHSAETSFQETDCWDCQESLKHWDPTGLMVDGLIRAVIKNTLFSFSITVFYFWDTDLEENFFSSLCQGL